MSPEDLGHPGAIGSAILAIGAVCTWLLRYNKAKSSAKREIHDDRAHEAKADLEVDLLENMRNDRIEAFAQRDYWQKQAQDAWAHQINDAKAIARLEAENAFLKHELAGVQTVVTAVKAQNERMRAELRNVRVQVDQLMLRIGQASAPRITTDFGSLDEEPTQ